MTSALRLTDISKSFDGFKALSGASFVVAPGEVHALLGENGAGKSTLMNVACGLYRPDEGNILIHGREAFISGPLEARQMGIGMVHQHYKLVKTFNAVENILLACGAARYGQGLVDIETAIRRTCEAVGFDVDLTRPVGSLSVAEQQRVEILKVLVDGAKILILDEPTAVLTDKEGEALLRMIRQLADNGAAVVLVTHKLGEVKGYADQVTVMRGGRTVATAKPSELSIVDLTSMVVGATIPQNRVPAAAPGEPVLTVSSLSGCRADGLKALDNASLTVRSGEIYSIAGVGGNGQTEFAEILMGVRAPLSGRVEIAGVGGVVADGPKRRRDLGLVSIPADRHAYGLAGDLSIADNYAVTGVLSGRFGGWLRVESGKIDVEAADAVGAFDVQGVRSLRQKAALLSGGNAQKLVIAREFSQAPKIVLAHSPSRGLDVRAASEVHRRLREARDAGAGVLLISEDLDEIMLLSDRIGVMSRGRIVGEFTAPADRQAIGAAMVHHG
ncbi:ABC transporter ATP-binding protein [Hyphomicrobium sp. CS1GBMeth3]|uniref:ABC transporter ATP-binding protein n=1 Tax=Hyphomicrobium sp. CS1GBMeth3 TaxID=1892845 RepID=UPI000931AE32|nr:ABC transporter ATP-binding protein [Hyphomicrobium sp. CS1GBMeth3]